MSAAPEIPLFSKLGIDPEGIEILDRIPVPKGSIAHGLAGAPPPMSTLSETFGKLSVEEATTSRWPFLLTRHALEPAVVRVEEGPPLRTCAGSAEVVEDVVLLDGRAGRESACVLDGPDETFIIAISQDVVTVARKPRAPTWSPLPDQFEVAPPSLAELLEGRACETWLQEQVAALEAVPTLVEQAAAVGLVVRLWEPDAAERAAILAGKASHPASAATAWVRALGASRRALSHLAHHRAVHLREAFDSLPNREEDPSEEDVLTLFRERDVLESVRVLLSLIGEGLPLARALALTDDVAATTWSAIAPSTRLREDPWLRAVFRAEPDSFWGSFAET